MSSGQASAVCVSRPSRDPPSLTCVSSRRPSELGTVGSAVAPCTAARGLLAGPSERGALLSCELTPRDLSARSFPTSPHGTPSLPPPNNSPHLLLQRDRLLRCLLNPCSRALRSSRCLRGRLLRSVFRALLATLRV